MTIQQVDKDIKVPMNEFDGKVIYGQKRKATGSGFESHSLQMAPAVAQLAMLEREAQLIYLKRHIQGM